MDTAQHTAYGIDPARRRIDSFRRRGLCSHCTARHARHACLVLALGILATAAHSQQGGADLGNAANPASQGGSRNSARNSDLPGLSSQMEQQLGDRRNVERQKSLEADTQKLLALALQLRDEVAKSNKDQLSVTVVKKSEEIEKLARNVKEKMRGY